MILPGIVEQQYCSRECRTNVLTQDGLICVCLYVSPDDDGCCSSKASGTKEVQLDRTADGENQEQSSKQKAIERQNETERK